MIKWFLSKAKLVAEVKALKQSAKLSEVRHRSEVDSLNHQLEGYRDTLDNLVWNSRAEIADNKQRVANVGTIRGLEV